MAKLTLISPNIVTQKGDFFGTGIPYMPIGLVYLATYLKEKGHDVQFIDSFGEKPFQIRKRGDFFYQGLTPSQISQKIKKTDLICVYAPQVYAHESVLEIIRAVKRKGPVAVIENTQAVTSYSLELVCEDFLNSGAKYVVLGEPEERILNLISKTPLKKIDGIIYRLRGKIIHQPVKKLTSNLDTLPFPDWSFLNLKNYWRIGYAHAPLSSKKYLPLLTSRGCPYNCAFCVSPYFNKLRWRARSAKNVVDEIEQNYWRFGVREFHLEDLNPTIDKKRMIEISKEILKRNLKICWKLSAGTKLETLDKETLSWMAKAGCTYVSFSPETGSRKILKLMKKPFNYSLGLELTKYMKELGITTQACFVLGFPGETKEELKKTLYYAKELTKAGVDEIALFILAPAPGSKICNKNFLTKQKLSQFTFSPTWREDYAKLHSFRQAAYLRFIFWKLIYNPRSLLNQLLSLLTKQFKTKMEMTLYRVKKIAFLSTFCQKEDWSYFAASRDNPILLSVIMPVYNEEKTIEEILKKVYSVKIPKEIIVVDDSTDKTTEIVKKFAKTHKNVKLVRPAERKGKGRAFKEGLKHARGEIVIVQDGDLEYNPEEYHQVIKPILDGQALVVYGSRFLDPSQKMQNILFLKKHKGSYTLAFLGGRILSILTSILFLTRLTDEATCYKCFKRELINSIKIKGEGFEWEPEVTAKILKKNIKIYEVPVSYKARTFKEGKKINWKDGVKAVLTLLYYRIFD